MHIKFIHSKKFPEEIMHFIYTYRHTKRQDFREIYFLKKHILIDRLGYILTYRTITEIQPF